MYMKHNIRIGDAIRGGWEHFTRRGWYLFGLTGAVVIIAAMVIGNAIATALYSIVIAGYVALLLKHARQEDVVFDDLFCIDRRWIYFAFGTIIKGLLITVGLVFFIVPGVYLAVRWMFSELYIIDKGMRPIEALRASSELTAGYRWKLFLYVLVAVLIGIAGMLAFGIGIIVSIAVVNLATIMLFWKLQEVQYLNAQERE